MGEVDEGGESDARFERELFVRDARTASRPKSVLVRWQRSLKPMKRAGSASRRAKPHGGRAEQDPGFLELVVRSRRSRILGGAGRAGGIALT